MPTIHYLLKIFLLRRLPPLLGLARLWFQWRRRDGLNASDTFTSDFVFWSFQSRSLQKSFWTDSRSERRIRSWSEEKRKAKVSVLSAWQRLPL